MTAEAIARVVADLRAGRIIATDPELALGGAVADAKWRDAAWAEYACWDVSDARKAALEDSWELRDYAATDAAVYRGAEPEHPSANATAAEAVADGYALGLLLVLTCHSCGAPVGILTGGRDTDQRAARVVKCLGGCQREGILQVTYLIGR